MGKKSEWVMSKMTFSIYNYHFSKRIFGTFSIRIPESTTQPFLFYSSHFLIFPSVRHPTDNMLTFHIPPPQPLTSYFLHTDRRYFYLFTFYFSLSPLLQHFNTPLLQQYVNGYEFFIYALSFFFPKSGSILINNKVIKLGIVHIITQIKKF